MKIKTEGNISEATSHAPKIKIGAKGDYHQVTFDLYRINIEDIYSLTQKTLSITIEEEPQKLTPL